MHENPAQRQVNLSKATKDHLKGEEGLVVELAMFASAQYALVEEASLMAAADSLGVSVRVAGKVGPERMTMWPACAQVRSAHRRDGAYCMSARTGRAARGT